MKTRIQTISGLLLAVFIVSCVAQSETVATSSLPTQTDLPVFTPTLAIAPPTSDSLSITPLANPTSEKLIQLHSLYFPEFDARYSTGDMALSHDGKFLAVVSKDKLYGENSVWIWSVNDLKQSLAGYQIVIGDLWSVAFSSNANTLAIGGTGKIIILDWETGNTLKTIELPNLWVAHVEFGPNGTLVSTGLDDKVVVWDSSPGEIKYSVDGIRGIERNSFTISPDGEVLVTGAYDGIHLWDFDSGQNLGFREGPDGGIGSAPVSVFSSKGNFLASSGCSEFIFEGCSRGKIIIWRADSDTPSLTTVIHSSWINALAFSPDERTLASAGGDGIIKLLDLNRGEIINVPSMDVPGKLPPDDLFLINDISFLSDGKLLAASTSDGIQLLNIADMSWMPNLRFILSLGYPYTITREGDNLNFRKEPSTKGQILKKLHTGEWFGVVDGPKIADDYVWWKVKTADDSEGWIIEMPGWYEFSP